jgi:hypothetical protein
MKKIILTLLIALVSLNANYTEKVKLPNVKFPIVVDEDFRAMQRNCQWCHSFGYITNQGNQSREFWHKVVVKMRDVYKAPISKRDEKITTDYLFRNYGNGRIN